MVSHCQASRSNFIRTWVAFLNELISLPNSEIFIAGVNYDLPFGKAIAMTARKPPEHLFIVRVHKYRSITNLAKEHYSHISVL